MKKERQFKQGVLVLLFLLFSVGVKAQYWIPLNYQPDKKPLVTHSDGLHYYACYEDGFTKFGKIIRISKWDGLVWQRATPLVLDSNASINAMCVFKGELYLGGDFYLPNITAIQNLIKLSENKWGRIKPGASFNNRHDKILTLASDDNGVYIGGEFDTIDKTSYKNMFFYNGEKLSSLGGFGANGKVSSLEFLDGVLYATGSFSEIDEVNSKGIAYYKSGKWLEIGNGSVLNTEQVVSFKGSPFIAVRNSTKFYFYTHSSGTTWTKNMNGLSFCEGVNDLIVYENKVYASGNFTFTDKEETGLATWNGTIWEKVDQNIYAPEFFEIFKGKIHAAGNLVRLQNINRPIYTARFEPNLVMVQGQVYWDKDENCSFSLGDEALSRERIKLNPSSRYLYTNEKGYYSALIDKTKEYTIEIDTKVHWKISPCASSIVKFNFDTDKERYINFPITIEPNKKDIRVDLSSGSGWEAAKGKRQFYKISYRNKGSVNQDGVINLKFDERLNDFEAYPAPNIYNPGNVSWRFKDLAINEQQEIGFYVRIDDIGINDKDNLNFLVSGTIADDENGGDNYDSLNQEVSSEERASIYKVMYPEPDYGDTISEIPSTTEFVEFVIHFENENDIPVRTVHIIDTIDLNLSLAHIQELGASHPYTTQVLNDPLNHNKGILIWTFRDINLEKFDSEGGSENPTFGYINFEMKLKQNSIGTVFSNQAKIIYDYTNEYLTNRVWGKIIDETIGINDIHYDDDRLEIYPNPIEVNTKVSLTDGFNSIQILDQLGKVVENVSLENTVFEWEIDLSHLPQGSYFMLVKNEGKVFVKKVLKK